MAKGNLRSFRYSDRVAELLEAQKGNSLNKKFENLVLYSHDQVPKVQKDLAFLQEQIDKKWKECNDLCARLREVSSLIGTLEQLQRYGEIAAKQARKITEKEL